MPEYIGYVRSFGSPKPVGFLSRIILFLRFLGLLNLDLDMLSGSNSYRAQQLEGGSQVVISLAVVGSATQC